MSPVVFQLYDQDGDGKISRAELLQVRRGRGLIGGAGPDHLKDTQVLRAMMGTQVTEEQLQSIADRAIQEADLDRDGAIGFDEFRKVRRTNRRASAKLYWTT